VNLDAGTPDPTPHAPDAGESCAQLEADYLDAVYAAKACKPGAPNQCQVAVNTLPSACPPTGCDVNGYVNDATGVNEVFSRWSAQCARATGGCPQIACPSPPSAAIVCVPTDAGPTGGVCTVVYLVN
jgi:hypothetical protein